MLLVPTTTLNIVLIRGPQRPSAYQLCPDCSFTLFVQRDCILRLQLDECAVLRAMPVQRDAQWNELPVYCDMISTRPEQKVPY